TFADAFGTGSDTDVFWYFISSQAAAEWEMGTGHMSDATTLVRDSVIASSNSNAAVSFSAGLKDVANDLPASRQAFIDQTYQQLMTAVAMNSMVLADVENFAQTPSQDRFADSFEDLTY